MADHCFALPPTGPSAGPSAPDVMVVRRLDKADGRLRRCDSETYREQTEAYVFQVAPAPLFYLAAAQHHPAISDVESRVAGSCVCQTVPPARLMNRRVPHRKHLDVVTVCWFCGVRLAYA